MPFKMFIFLKSWWLVLQIKIPFPVFTDNKVLSLCCNKKQSLNVTVQEMLREDVVCEPAAMDSEDVLFLLYTSGSTGKPKGLVHTQAGYLLYAALTHRVTSMCRIFIFFIIINCTAICQRRLWMAKMWSIILWLTICRGNLILFTADYKKKFRF